MTKNIFIEYINSCTKDINKYLKFIFKRKYNKEIAEEYIKTYINSRYYNLTNNSTKRAFYLKIRDSLKTTMEELHAKNKKEKQRTENYILYNEKEKIINDMCSVFDFIFFFDNVREVDKMTSIDSLKQIIDQLYQKRESEYLINERESTKKEFYSMVNKDMIQREIFLDNCLSEDFEILLNRINETENVYKARLQSKITMPMIYSKKAIEKAFNSKSVVEDRLVLQYILLSIIVTRDIIEANFKDQYIVEFAPSILTKQNKLNQTLEYLDDPALQDKINLNIMYEDFIKNEEKIYTLMKKGYKFAVTIDETTDDIKEIGRLAVFSYIIVNKKQKICKELKKHKEKLKIIEE